MRNSRRRSATTTPSEPSLRASPSPAAAAAAADQPPRSSPMDDVARGLYSVDETSELPDTAVLASLGCGNPTALAELNPGEVVLDLGSGGGIDVLLSARRVGPAGKAYGIDMTDEMLALARENQREGRRRERRVPQGRARGTPPARRLGRRDHQQLRRQPLHRQGPRARRGLPGAQARRPLRHQRRALPGRHEPSCRGRCSTTRTPGRPASPGALEERDFIARLSRAGFPDASVEVTNVYDGSAENNMCGAPPMPEGVRLVSGFVRADQAGAQELLLGLVLPLLSRGVVGRRPTCRSPQARDGGDRLRAVAAGPLRASSAPRGTAASGHAVPLRRASPQAHV